MSTRKPESRKAKPVKARRMWAAPETFRPAVKEGWVPIRFQNIGPRAIPVAVLEVSDPGAVMETALKGYYEGAGGFMGGIKGVLVKLGILTKAQANAYQFTPTVVHSILPAQRPNKRSK